MKIKNYKNSPRTTPSHVKNEKKSNFAVFEIANNFIVEIPFLAQRLARKKLRTLKAPRNTPNLLLFAPKIRKKF